MVTLDKIVKNVKEFNGDLTQGAKDYERAKQGKALIEEMQKEFKESIKEYSGFDKFNLPEETDKQEVIKGKIKFAISSNKTTKRPAYKTAVTEIQNYLNTVNYMASRGQTISGVAKEQNKWVMSIDKVLEEFQIRKQEITLPGITQKITYKTKDKIETPQELDLNNMDKHLNEPNFLTYIHADKIKENLEAYIKDYETALESSGEDTVQVNKKKAYEAKENTKEITGWYNILKTMISDDDKEEGEIEILADPTVSFAEKKRELPFYDIFMREVRGEKKLYVGLESVYNRIEDLKEQNMSTSTTTKYVAKELV